jgi:hypothetical protein
MDEIVKKMKEVKIDEKEFECIKEIVLFDKNEKGLSD